MNRLANRQAEAAVLGAVLIDGTLFNDLIIQEEHFYEQRHRVIFRAMNEVAKEEQPIDIVTVTTALGSEIKQVGTTIYLLEMVESIASTATLKTHEQLILDAYQLRKSREYVMRFANDPSEEKLATLIQQLQQCSEMRAKQEEKTVADYLIEIADDICFPSEASTGVATDFQELDDLTGGLQKGDLIIVAARPSVGKTAFALQLAATHAKNGGFAHFYSLEMGMKPLLERIISTKASINGQKWRHLAFSADDYERALAGIGAISTWQLFIHDSLRSVHEIRAAVRKKVYDHPDENHFVIIDYLQLMSSIGTYERRDLEVGDITRELKQLAIELDIPIVLLSQLSRKVESRPDKRPMMSDLRESGNIEQDADVIAFLYRDDYYDQAVENKGRIELIVSKQRNGPVGTIELEFYKKYGRFSSVQRELVHT